MNCSVKTNRCKLYSLWYTMYFEMCMHWLQVPDSSESVCLTSYGHNFMMLGKNQVRNFSNNIILHILGLCSLSTHETPWAHVPPNWMFLSYGQYFQELSHPSSLSRFFSVPIGLLVCNFASRSRYVVCVSVPKQSGLTIYSQCCK